jgi:hypothetical protein
MPKAPSVVLLIDRSGTMFDCLSTASVEPSCATKPDTAWEAARVAAESVLGKLQDQIRFGFAAYTGAAGGTCPILNKVSPQLQNKAAIATVYDGLPFPPNSTVSGQKFEGPAGAAMNQIVAELAADTGPGDKVIVYVTRGTADFCDDSSQLCGPDSLVGAMQKGVARGIRTVVVGLLPLPSFVASSEILETYANAGAGEPTKPAVSAASDVNAIYDQCNSTAPWRAEFLAGAPECTSISCRGRGIGTYQTSSGPTKPYKANAADAVDLEAQMAAAVASAKACTFDLGGSSWQLDTTKLSQAKVLLGGTEIAFNDPNGWKVNTTTQIELVGSACFNWRKPDVNVDFQFPCSVLEPSGGSHRSRALAPRAAGRN